MANGDWRLVAATALLLLAAGTAGLVEDSGIVVAVAGAALFTGVIVVRSSAWLGSIAILFVLTIYLPSRPGLYGRDSHSEALVTATVVDNGVLPESVVAAWSFLETPLLYVMGAVASRITGLDPMPPDQILISQLLPIAFVAATLTTAWAMYRQIQPERSVLMMVPLVLWMPFFIFRLGFRRGSISIVLFALGVFTLYRYQTTGNSRFALLLIAIPFPMTLAHHLTAGLYILCLGCFFLSRYLPSQQLSTDSPVMVSGRILLITGIIPLTWFVVVVGSGGEKLAGIVLSILGISAVPTPSAPYDLEPSVLGFVSDFVAVWAFVGILGILTLAGGWWQMRERGMSPWLAGLIPYGAIIAALAFASWLALPVAPSRVLTFFVVVGGGIGISYLSHNTRSKWPVQTVVLLLVVSSLFMIPYSVIPGQAPAYSHGEFGQQFDQQMYDSAEWNDQYITKEEVVGDANVREVVVPIAQLPVQTAYPQVTSAELPPERTVILREENRHLYKGPWGGGWAYTTLEHGIERYDRSSNRVYTNGNVKQWVSSLNSWDGRVQIS
ncbi:hypothetical protein [Haloarchaeobius iranensis]|uniref:Dolichyl-phosphate-mannose-protein mannosyltransferase n=1 Tax=Haloarchaeobius iranensis TaxID=996166 RepID=A0A1H0BVU2_9EURY|nr:hypothetical protein [Haloarchaeobius iranensis]SDN49590.1 hypothetical protein SAMN05192554_1492 [Haloarchaeobius iranensis]